MTVVFVCFISDLSAILSAVACCYGCHGYSKGPVEQINSPLVNVAGLTHTCMTDTSTALRPVTSKEHITVQWCHMTK